MKKIRILCLVVVMALITAAPAMALTDSSGKPGGFRYDDIEGAWYQGHAEAYGYPEIFEEQSGKFQPNKNITRMEFARLLHKALDIRLEYFVKPDIKDFFNDVENEAPGADALYDLVSTGIIEREDSFYPDLQLDREIMIHYIINALNYATGGEYAMIMIMPEPFDDDGEISEEYRDDVIKSVVLKLVYGYENNRLHPKQGATRAEAVAVVDRLLKLTGDLTKEVTVAASASETEDGLLMTLRIINHTDRTVSINHTSGQKYDFQLIGTDGEVLYTWSADKMFIMAMQTTEIEAGESIAFSEVLEGEAYGQVKGKVGCMKAYITGSSDDFSINPDGYVAMIS